MTASFPHESPPLWRWKGGGLTLGGRPKVMGVLNVTPDSFSDGGRFLDTEAAIAHGEELIRQGADLLDIGGESTRPGAAVVSVDEELRRVLPVIRGLKQRCAVPISIDTQKVEVARAAVEAGASIVNDVAANRTDPEMWRFLAQSGAGYIAMHMQGTPQTMQDQPRYEDVVRDIEAFFERTLETLVAFGVGLEQVAIDPGIGFGKTVEQNLKLLGRLKDFVRLGRPLVLGVSRKSVLGAVTGTGTSDRTPAGLACAVWAALQGGSVIRTHDVAPTVQALVMTAAIDTRAA